MARASMSVRAVRVEFIIELKFINGTGTINFHSWRHQIDSVFKYLLFKYKYIVAVQNQKPQKNLSAGGEKRQWHRFKIEIVKNIGDL